MKKIIGIAVNPQERAWIEKWTQDQKGKSELIDLKYEGLMKRAFIFDYIKDKGILDEEIDGIVIHTINFDDRTYLSLKAALQDRGLELHSTTGETGRPSWRSS